MIASRLVALAMFAYAGTAFSQYPTRGAPDPAWNGGQLRIVELGGVASGYDVSFWLASLSGTRHAVATVRYFAANDAILVVDTAPERITTFILSPPPGAGIDQVYAIAPAGSALLVGGVRARADGKRLATIELRELGVDPVPVFESRGELVVTSSNPAVPDLQTTAVRADVRASGPILVWQVRSAGMPNSDCSAATMHRLDHVAAAFSERAALDVSAGLARPCLYINTVTLAPARAGDPPGAQALLLSGFCTDALTMVRSVCATRVLDNNAALSIDRNYGTNGLATVGAGPENLDALDHVADTAGNLLVAVTRGVANGPDVGQLLRLRADGNVDASFSTGGFVTVSAGAGNRSRAIGIALAGNNVVQLVGNANGPSGIRPYIFYYDLSSGASQFARVELPPGGPNYAEATFSAVVALPAGGALAIGEGLISSTSAKPLIAKLAGDRETVTLVEYFHAAFGHYFVTALANEIRLLDDGVLGGWRRTGESFAALTVGASGALDVCRFFSATFAPKSSHFYTPFTAECEGLKAGTTWTFEGNVFALSTPGSSGACPTGTRALHRLYNDGMSGAPNHRYVVRELLRVAQAGLGWVQEGLGSPPVFACVPS